jgi:hypothetical protein
MRRVLAPVGLALAALLLASGCEAEASFAKECAERGGDIEVKTESCKKKVTKGSGSNRKTTTRPGKRTETMCIKDGEEIDEHEGACH